MNYKQFILSLLVLSAISCKEQNKHLYRIEGRQITINDSLQSNLDIETFIKPYRDHITKDLDSVLAYAVDTYSKSDGDFNTAIGNFMADAVYEQANPVFKSRTGKDIQNATNGFSYSGSKLYYSFYNSFPTSIASMPVSYESSSLLKCTVSFTYDRYVTTNTSTNSNSQNSSQSVPPGSPTAVGVPDSSVSYNPVGPVNPQTQAAINAGYTRNLNSNISPN